MFHILTRPDSVACSVDHSDSLEDLSSQVIKARRICDDYDIFIKGQRTNQSIALRIYYKEVSAVGTSQVRL